MLTTKKIYQFMIVAILAFSGVYLSAQSNISGIILDDQSAGLENVAVVIDATHQALTAQDGTYTIANVGDGDYTIVPTLSGYTFDPVSIDVTVAGSDLQGNDFLAIADSATTYSISGTVLDDQGAGLENVNVGVDATHIAQTGIDGNYTITDVVDGPYTITAALNGYTFAPVSIDVTVSGADLIDQDFTGTADSATTYSISGTVLDDQGAGLENVTVGFDQTHIAQTDIDGNYTIANVEAGTHIIAASLAGYTFTPATIEVTVVDADVIDQNFTGTADSATTYSISGTVLDDQGAALENVTVGFDQTHITSTAPNGTYTITNVDAGTHTVAASLNGYTFTPATIEVTVVDADVPDQNFTGTPQQALPTLPVTDGLVLWLDGADPDADGSSVVGPLGTWKDKSPLQNDAVAAQGEEMTVVPGVLGGWSALASTPTSTYTLTDEVKDSRTIFWVVKETAYDADNPHFLLGDTDSFDFSRDATGAYWDGTYAAGPVKDGFTYNNGILVNDPKTELLPLEHYNLVSLVTTDTDPVAFNTISKDRTFARSWDGNICEIIVYNTALNDTDRNAVEDYLRTKWGADIQVKGKGDIEIANGDDQPSVDDGTDFGLPVYQGDIVSQEFSITNDGVDALIFTGVDNVVIDGDTAFTVSTQPQDAFASGETASFTIDFTAPADDAVHEATVVIETSAQGKTPYTFKIVAQSTTSNAPAIIVKGNGIEIPNGADTPIVDDNTDFGTLEPSAIAANEFVISNTGTVDLELTDAPDAVSITNESTAGAFSVTTQATSPITPGISVPFVINFSADTAGVYTATVSIASNDTNKDPYTFNIKAEVASEVPLTVPGLELWFDAADPNGDGSDPVAGPLAVWKDKAKNHDAVQDDTALQATVVTNAIGDKSVVSFDANTTPFYSFSEVSGIKTVFWILKETDHSAPHFFLGDSDSYQFSRGDSGEFWQSVYADNPVKTGATYLDGTLVVDPMAELFPAGKFHMVSLVANDDPANPLVANQLTRDRGFAARTWSGEIAEVLIYTETLSDTDRQKIEQYLMDKWSAPKIIVKGKNDIEITNGDNTPSIDDGTDFGAVLVGGNGLEKTFTIDNNGNSELDIQTIEILDGSGIPVNDFSVTDAPSAPIAASDSTTFTIKFAPTAEEVTLGTVTVTSNDASANPFTFAIQGEGSSTASPVISVKGNGIEIIAGSTTPSLTDGTDFGTVMLGQSSISEFTIFNTGSAALNINNIIITGTGQYSVIEQPEDIVAPNGGSTSFSVIFSPDTENVFDAEIQIETNADPNPFTFAITGKGVDSVVKAIPGLTLWLDANDPNADGSAPVDGALTVWNDKSDNGNDAEQPLADNQAVITTGAVQGKAVLTFDGQDDFYSLLGRVENARTVFWVVKETELGNAGDSNFHFLLGDTEKWDFHRGDGVDDGGLWSYNASAGVRDGKTYVDGVEFTAMSTNTPAGVLEMISLVATEDLSTNQITKDRTYDNRSWFGDIAEIIIYNRELPDAERKQVEAYLNEKWFGQAPTTYSISGTVTGDVQEGVAITLSGDTSQTVLTATDGTYSFGNLMTGDYQVSALLGGYDFAPETYDVSINDADVTDQDFDATAIAQTYKVSGTILDASQEAVAGVTVEVDGKTAETAADGTYFITGLSNGQYTATPTADGYTFEPISAPVDITDADVIDVNFVATSTGPVTYSISGIVKDADDNLLQNVVVEDASGHSAITDLDGKYVLEGLPSGDYFLTATLDSYTFTSVKNMPVRVDGANLTDVDFIGTAVQTYTLTVVGGQGSGDYTEGKIVTITADPAPADQMFDAWIVDIQYVTDASLSVTTVNMPASSVTVEATYKAIPADTYTVSGTVSGDVVEGVLLTLSGDSSQTTKTDASGIYSFVGLSNGNYKVTPSADGYTFLPASTDLAIADEDVADINFSSTADPIEHVLTVNNGTGSGSYAEGAKVEIVATVPADQVFVAWTGDVAAIEDVHEATTTVTIPTADVTVTATFEPAPVTYSISGTVLEPTGSPIENVEVSDGNGHSAITDPDGKYIISELPNGSYTLTAALTGYEFSTDTTMPVTINGADVAGIDFTGTSLPKFNLSVTNGEGSGDYFEGKTVTITADKAPTDQMFDTWVGDVQYVADVSLSITTVTMPASNVTVEATYKAIPADTYTVSGTVSGDLVEGVLLTLTGDSSQTTKTDASGIYSFVGLSNGHYTVTPSADGFIFGPETADVEVTDADVADINFASTVATYSISGTILDDNNTPLQGVEVSVGYAPVQTDENGIYVIDGLVNGEYTVTPAMQGYTFNPVDQAVTISGDSVTGIDFTAIASPVDSYSISGKILDADSNPIEGVEVSDGNGHSASTTASGEYAILGLDNGDYTLTATLAGYELTTDVPMPVTINGANVTAVDFVGTVISGDYSISGTILDVDGNPVENVSVKVDAAHMVVTDADGVYGITSLVSGDYNVTPTLAGYAFTPATIKVTVIDVDVTDIDFTARVNVAPVAKDDPFFTMIQDTDLVVPVNGVLANDTDVNASDILTAHLVDDVQNGTLVLNADGSFTYTPTAGYTGTDTFTYVANDGTVDSNVATVSIDVKATGAEISPIALDDQYTVTVGDSIDEAVPGILANDIGTSLTATLVDDVQNGTLVLNADGSFTYEPAAGYTGLVTFTYTANDGALDSNVATVTITVNAAAPIAVDDSYEVELNSTLIVAVEKGVLANDTDPDGGTLTAALVDDVQHGTLTLNSSGSFTYEPESDYMGPDTFTYVANNGTLDSDVATVTITVTIQKVTIGIPVSVTPQQAGLPDGGTFDKGKAKIYGELDGKKLTLKKDKSSTETLVKGTWAKKYPLYDKKAVKNGYAAAIDGTHQARDLQLKVKGKSNGTKFENLAQFVKLVPPEIYSVTVSGTSITITGRFFGTKAPKVALEPVSGKLAKCKVDKKSYIFDAPSGLSSVTATYKSKKAPTGQYRLVLDNKIGIGVELNEDGKEVLPTVDIP